MPEHQETRVLWLTNLPAPYRFPIWDRMAEDVQLKVVFLLKRKNWRNWPEPVGKSWNHQFMSFNSLQISEYDIIPSFRGSRKLLKNIDVAIIGGWESPMYIRTILSAKKYGIKVVQFYESSGDTHRFNSGVVSLIRRWIFSKPDLFFTISNMSAQALIEMGVSEKKIKVLFNPVDVAWYNQYANSHRVPESPGHRYLFVGQLIPRKNVLGAIRAFAQIAHVTDTFMIAGSGPLKTEIEELIADLKLQNQVFLLGQKDKEEIALLYARSHTLVMPSTSEVWGLVANEALASGAQVIVSKISGVSQFIKGMRGVFICSDFTDSIAEMMHASRSTYIGPIVNPEILRFTPERFAEELNSFLFPINDWKN